MTVPLPVPEDKHLLIGTVVSALSGVPNLAAVALGGSYATGTQTSGSDLDFGLYYDEDAPFAIERIAEAAGRLSDAGSRPVVTGFYEWGPWVNGGAWIHTPGGKVDLLYRNLDHVRRTIDQTRAGTVEHDYAQQPPYGFYSVIYLAETRVCIPLHDPSDRLAELKARVAVYPEQLRRRVLGECLWNAEFALSFARGSAAAGDVYSTVGSLARVASNLTQAVFALNREYFLTDKRALTAAASFALLPPGYPAPVIEVLAHPGSTATALMASVLRLQEVWRDVVTLTDGAYRPRYPL